MKQIEFQGIAITVQNLNVCLRRFCWVKGHLTPSPSLRDILWWSCYPLSIETPATGTIHTALWYSQDPSHLRLQPVALSNSFFGSACREWQDQLALGLHGNITACGRRGDKRPRNCSDWKDKYYELEWGERSDFHNADFYFADDNV